MGGFLTGFGDFVSKVGPTTADLFRAVNQPTINYNVPAAPAPAVQTPAPANPQGQGSLGGELLIAALVAVAALLIYREMSKRK